MRRARQGRDLAGALAFLRTHGGDPAGWSAGAERVAPARIDHKQERLLAALAVETRREPGGPVQPIWTGTDVTTVLGR